MLILDTHVVIAILQGELTDKEHNLVLSHQLAISDIVIWEIAKLIQIDRLRMDMESIEFRRFRNALTVFPITIEIALQSTQLDFKSDPADEIIAATSIVHDLPLLTRDKRILGSKMIPFVD